jgi:flagellin FlaB
MGIGTLIIFIAMILVAAIAAGVLIQTATSLQNKALLTGERSKGQISTSLRPMTMYAEDGSTGASVDTFYVDLKLAPGSDPIRLQDMLVEFSLKDTASDLEYSSDPTACTAPNATHFGVQYLIRGVSYASGYIQRGDVIKLCFNSSRSVTEDETINLLLVPKIGSPTSIETAMPDIITEQRVTVYP